MDDFRLLVVRGAFLYESNRSSKPSLPEPGLVLAGTELAVLVVLCVVCSNAGHTLV